MWWGGGTWVVVKGSHSLVALFTPLKALRKARKQWPSLTLWVPQGPFSLFIVHHTSILCSMVTAAHNLRRRPCLKTNCEGHYDQVTWTFSALALASSDDDLWLPSLVDDADEEYLCLVPQKRRWHLSGEQWVDLTMNMSWFKIQASRGCPKTSEYMYDLEF